MFKTKYAGFQNVYNKVKKQYKSKLVEKSMRNIYIDNNISNESYLQTVIFAFLR